MRDAHALEALERDLRTEYPELAELEAEANGLDAALTDAARRGDSEEFIRAQMRQMALPSEMEEARAEAAHRLKVRLENKLPGLREEAESALEEAREARGAGIGKPENHRRLEGAQRRRGRASGELDRREERLRQLKSIAGVYVP